ncbi:aspartate dehydrogenase domain-containing protein [Martelella radicis]|uniref:Aspartate dehydrogenase n=1 Tax=Martelella radicis TaxID=1397476 RepID=A0A7W6PC59_9HYPH|nr:aspartate dehydrogenase domain-containing protein [Martelella radicis]MBB4123339.1 aspartate dehydrogenase [Martelella radicis]
MAPNPPIKRETCVLLGYGRIGRRIAGALLRDRHGPALAGIVARNPAAISADLEDPAIPVFPDIHAALATKPDLVIECASPPALAGTGAEILAAGADLVALSLTAFADPAVETRLRMAAKAGPGRLHIPSGAAAALPLLRVARKAGLEKVRFRQTYLPSHWAKIAGENDAFQFTGSFFEGSVRSAAARFPFNLNAAVGVALAGAGLDDTVIELIGDPGVGNMRYALDIESCGAPIRLDIGPYRDRPPEGPDHTAYSILAMLSARSEVITF